MPKTTEFTITIEDKPGAIGRCFLALGASGVNVLAFQTYVEDRESLARIVVDDAHSAKTVLGQARMIFEQTEVAVVSLPHSPGELGLAASKLGEHKININHCYCGLEPNSSHILAVFGVDNLTQAAKILDAMAGE